jgi:acetate kinase
LGFLGIEIEVENNSPAQSDREISPRTSKVRALVIRAQEDWAIAQECVRLFVGRKF